MKGEGMTEVVVQKINGMLCRICGDPLAIAVAGLIARIGGKEFVIATNEKLRCDKCDREITKPLFFVSLEDAERQRGVLEEELRAGGFSDSSLQLSELPERVPTRTSSQKQ